LHGFWSWQEHTEAECVQILTLTQPVVLFHDFPMHQTDLRGRPTEGHQSDAKPNAEVTPI
jgi:hypothetical protein